MTADERAAVYRFFDTAGQLLYVGMTERLNQRFIEHRYASAWWPVVDASKTAVVWYPDRKQAEAAELAGIVEELPKHNVQGIDGRYYGQARTGVLSHEHQLIAARVEAISDPAERARQAGVEINTSREESIRLAAVRRRAIVDMRTSGIRVVEISHVLDIHRDRVYEILRTERDSE